MFAIFKSDILKHEQILLKITGHLILTCSICLQSNNKNAFVLLDTKTDPSKIQAVAEQLSCRLTAN